MNISSAAAVTSTQSGTRRHNPAPEGLRLVELPRACGGNAGSAGIRARDFPPAWEHAGKTAEGVPQSVQTGAGAEFQRRSPHATTGAWAFSSERFRHKIAKALGRRVTPLPAGRPKREVADKAQPALL